MYNLEKIWQKKAGPSEIFASLQSPLYRVSTLLGHTFIAWLFLTFGRYLVNYVLVFSGLCKPEALIGSGSSQCFILTDPLWLVLYGAAVASPFAVLGLLMINRVIKVAGYPALSFCVAFGISIILPDFQGAVIVVSSLPDIPFQKPLVVALASTFFFHLKWIIPGRPTPHLPNATALESPAAMRLRAIILFVASVVLSGIPVVISSLLLVIFGIPDNPCLIEDSEQSIGSLACFNLIPTTLSGFLVLPAIALFTAIGIFLTDSIMKRYGSWGRGTITAWAFLVLWFVLILYLNSALTGPVSLETRAALVVLYTALFSCSLLIGYLWTEIKALVARAAAHQSLS